MRRRGFSLTYLAIAVVVYLAIFGWTGSPRIIRVPVRVVEPTPTVILAHTPLHLKAHQSFSIHCGQERIGPLTVGLHEDQDTDALYMEAAQGVHYDRIIGTYADKIVYDGRLVGQVILNTPAEGADAYGANGCIAAISLGP